jgi:Glu-tRNA(Gln) amidotransferase subunit E-like FAD-binding protein
MLIDNTQKEKTMNINHEQFNKILEEIIDTKLHHIVYTVDKILALLQKEEVKKVVNTSFGQKHLDIANEMYKVVNATTKTKKPDLNQWANEIRKIDEIDKIPTSNILKVFKVANKDDFWSMNIRSPKKLRKHWDRLHLLSLKSQGLNSKGEDKRESLDYFKEKQW